MVSWDEYFFSIAKLASYRSPDAETKHGTVIVKDNKIIGTGYNGFPRKMDDSTLPNRRPDKYVWMIHSEANAVLNCTASPQGATAYVTGECCFECLKTMWQAGIVHVKQIKSHGSKLITDETRKNVEIFLEQTKMKIEFCNFEGVLFSTYNESVVKK